jgi:hypothetical protein
MAETATKLEQAIEQAANQYYWLVAKRATTRFRGK